MLEKGIGKNGIINSRTPADDGYFMPGEFEAHQGCIMIWPERPGSWTYGAAAARKAFRSVIAAIAESEKVYVAAGKRSIRSAREMLSFSAAGNFQAESEGWQRNVEIFEAETDDAWARDIAPSFVVKRQITESKRLQRVRAVNWEFNAWGGEVDGLYASWEKDNAFARFFAEKYGIVCYDAAPFVLEGGSIHSDGEGTILVTEACLLSKGRNPMLNKIEIEDKLKSYLGAKKVIWLPRGIYQDETNEHVDNICTFIRPGEVVLAWTDHKEDPQYELSLSCLKVLQQERDAKGREFSVHKLPVPSVPICVTREDLKGYEFEPGEDKREAGERLAASYVNFYFSNNAVILPAFGGENEESDRLAAEILHSLCPERKIVPIDARDILAGGGNIHCITQQIPVCF